MSGSNPIQIPSQLKFCALILFLLSLVWSAGFYYVGFRALPVTAMGHALNDQVGYVGGARALVDTGTIEPKWILPSTLGQTTRTKLLYVPGHYFSLAAGFYLFGVNYFTEVLPSLIGFLLLVIFVYLATGQLYGENAAKWAALFAACSPYVFLFSLTSMAELTVMAASVLAFYVSLKLPTKVRPFLGALVVLFPVMFRETSVLILFPVLAAFLQKKELKTRRRDCFIFVLVTFLGFLCLFKWPLGGRPNLMLAQMFGGFKDLYTDALFFNSFNPSGFDWIRALISRLFENIRFLFRLSPFSFEIYFNKGIVFLSVLFFLVGALRKSLFEFSVGFMGLSLCSLQMAVYTPASFRATRVFLLLTPFMAMVLGFKMARWQISNRIKTVIAFLVVVGSFKYGFYNLARQFSLVRTQEQKIIAFIDSLNPERDKVFIGPFWLVSPWVQSRYPVRWSFLPANNQTFEMLQAQYPVGTLLLHDSELGAMPLENLRELGYPLAQEMRFDGGRYFVFYSQGAPPQKKNE